MATIDQIRASDGTGNASVATVTSTRAPAASTIVVDTVVGINTNFIGSMGTPHTFIDPVTSEEITVISEATAVDFKGHVDGANLEIDTIAPGYTDAGSAVGDIIIIRPTTQWGDALADVLEVAHDDDGTLKDGSVTAGTIADNAITSEADFTDNVDPVKRQNELMFDHVASGCVWSGDAYASTRVASMTAGVVYIAGKRLTVAAVVARTFTASKDVYIGLIDAGNGTATVVYYDNTTNAASPSLATAGYIIVIGIIVVGATNIAAVGSVNQGEETKVLPIASSIPYAVTDSLGNLICPRDPDRKILGYRQRISAFTTTNTSATQITGLSCPVIVPTGRKVKISIFVMDHYVNAANVASNVTIWDGTVGSSTQLARVRGFYTQSGSAAIGPPAQAINTPTSASKTYNAGLHAESAGTANFDVTDATNPGFILVELV